LLFRSRIGLVAKEENLVEYLRALLEIGFTEMASEVEIAPRLENWGFFEHLDSQYMWMASVTGQLLSNDLRNGSLKHEEKIQLYVDLVQQLEKLHKQALLVHGDIRLSNIVFVSGSNGAQSAFFIRSFWERPT
jgi:tRNA A-37 threonylcarbamoyl transferase component Bud32